MHSGRKPRAAYISFGVSWKYGASTVPPPESTACRMRTAYSAEIDWGTLARAHGAGASVYALCAQPSKRLHSIQPPTLSPWSYWPFVIKLRPVLNHER